VRSDSRSVTARMRPSSQARPKSPNGSARTLALLLVFACAALAIGLAAGSSGWGAATPEILWQVRLPRVLSGFGAGAALALSGALMQLLTRNALADPYVLGISGGAAVGALSVLWLAGLGGVALVPEWSIGLGAGLGAIAAAAVLFACSWRLLGGAGVAATQESSVALLLVGVMIGTACSAFVSMLLALASEGQLRGMVFWLLGDLNGATQWALPCGAAALALALVAPGAHQLDLMARGDAWAATLGVPVARRRRLALAAAALATGAAVATAGAIGFVGLVVPHALRLIGVRAAPALLPASALGGGAFVVLADAVARTVVAPLQLPVGVLAAAVGVPSFLVLLLRRPRGIAR
jgi:iron complex transport system permease protein